MKQLSLVLPEMLKYGIAGLGALLAILTFLLIVNAQRNVNKKPGLIFAVYIFMAFSIALILVGLFA